MSIRSKFAAFGLAAVFAAALSAASAEARQAPDRHGLMATPTGYSLGMPSLAAMLDDAAGLTQGEEAMKVAQRRRSGRRGFGTGLGVGLGLGILGAAILTDRARADRAGFERAWAACDRDYRSFNRNDGTVITYRHGKMLCPYLEPYVDY